MEKDINKKLIIRKNEYITTNILGKGFSGIVYEAQNIKTQDKVAIKIINKNILNKNCYLII
jgi:serine/threonine protein kinase